ncbi:hypothetical protein FRC01_004451 [Tulasnella sp. 417]|nr:hypothetical protein FRC01_004451 [Tulasnella sp. 417]
MFNVISHAHNYRVPGEQRQILRILYLPMIYALLSFFSYRFFSAYTYFSLGEAVYEAFALSAFLLLLVHFVAATTAEMKAEEALANKPKMRMPFPLSRYEVTPSKPSFLHKVKWAVLQYVIVNPLTAIATVITQEAGVLCQGSWDFHFASVYLRIIDLLSMLCALYGLILFYIITKDLLAHRRTLVKFVAVKIVVFLSVVQNFILTILDKNGAIHGTKMWTESNVVNGINAICICVEMVLISALMLWAYSPSEYKNPAAGEKRSVLKAYWDSINISDVVREIATSLKFIFSGSREDRAWTQDDRQARPHFDRAFIPNRPYNMAQYPYSPKEDGVALAAPRYSDERRSGSQEYQPPAFAPERATHHGR